MKKRILFEKLEKQLYHKTYTIIVGARQTGKTTILKQLYQTVLNQKDTAYYITFENLQILNSINENPENIFRFADKVFLKQPDKKLFLFIDEIQYAKNPTNFLKYLYDIYEDKIKIVATGSSAFYIDKNFKDSLAGRKRVFQLKTLSFNEFLFFLNAEELQIELNLIRQNPDYVSVKRNEINYYFEEYLCYGAYPAVVLEKDNSEKIEILKELKNSYLKKDINESGALHEQKFMHLMTLMAEQIGNLVNKNELSNTLSIDSKTVEHYLRIMQKSFHINLISPFFNNLRKELTKMPKIYFSDLGLRNSLLNNYEIIHNRRDKGEIIENYMYNRFSEIYDSDSIYFWRTAEQNEVDFVIKENNEKINAYEIKYSENLIKQKKYKTFVELYPAISLQYLTYETINNLLSKNVLCI